MSEEKNIKAPQKQGNTGGGMHGMGDVPEKPKDLKQSLTKLIEFCKSYLPAMIFALVTAAIGTVFQIIGPDKIKDLINEISKGITVSIDLDAVFRIGMLLVFFYGASAILSFLQSFIMATATQRISKDLRTVISMGTLKKSIPVIMLSRFIMVAMLLKKFLKISMKSCIPVHGSHSFCLDL